jgi:hypothetical protein
MKKQVPKLKIKYQTTIIRYGGLQSGTVLYPDYSAGMIDTINK